MSKYYQHCGEERKGEVDPDVLFFENALTGLLKRCEDDIRIVVLLREPVDRAYSHYQMMRARGREQLSFKDAIRREKLRMQKGYWQRLHYSYFSRGLYAKQLKRVYTRLDREQVMVSYLKDWKEDLTAALSTVFDHINVSQELPAEVLNDLTYNKYRKPIVPGVNRILYSRAFRNVGRLLIPSERIRRRVSRALHWVVTASGHYPPLSDEDRLWLEKRYRSDVEVYPEIVGHLPPWWKSYRAHMR